MDIPFLKLMSEAYVSDSSDNLNINEVSNYLLTSFGKFKISYPEVARELYSHSRSYQQDLIYSFLDKKYSIKEEHEIDIEDEYIDESALSNTFKSIWMGITTFIKKLKLGFEKQLPPEQQFMVTLIEKNYNNCNRTCSPDFALNPNQLADLMYINPLGSSDHRKTISEILKRQPNFNTASVSRCIRACYLDYMTSIYAEGIIAFENCVKHLNGTEITINNYSDILKNYPISGMCNEIYITLNDLYKEIDRLLDYIYLKDSFKKKKWLDIIFLKLDSLRKGRLYRIDFSKVDDEFELPGDNVRIVSQ